MKTYPFLKMIMACVIYLFSFTSIHAQDDAKQLLQDVMATWDFLNTNVKVHQLSKKTSADSVKTFTGAATLFGQSVGLEVAFKSKTEIRRVMIDFPEAANLNTDQFRAIFGKNKDDILPKGFGARLGIRHFEIDIDNKKVDHVNVVMNMGTWAPASDNSGNSVTLSDINAEFGLMEIQSREPNILVALESYIHLPREAANYIGIGETTLKIRGYANTATMKLALAAQLSSEEIPLVSDKTLVLRNAQFEFAFENGKPQIAVGGQMEIRSPGEKPFQLYGDVSIDVTGKIYGQGFMGKDKPTDPEPYIRNPFGLSDMVYITRAGLGFGLDFKTTPIPTPSLAIEGGIAVKKSPTAAPLFAGAVTLAVDPTEPKKTIIDADVTNAKLSYIIDAFHTQGTPPQFVETLKKINLEKLHLTVVPPGPSVEIFGRTYDPGFYGEGKFKFGDFTGAMLIDIDEDGVEAFGGMTPLDFQHFKLTGIVPNTGPYIYLSIKPSEGIYALAVNGKIEVMGAHALTDIYLSDQGFNATMKTKIFNEFSAEVDVAGSDFLNKNGSIYAKVNMVAADNLVKRIGQEASDEINRMADDTEKDFDTWDGELKKYKPLYEQRGRELTALQNKVRKRYERLCGLMNQKKNNETAQKQKKTEITNLKSEINRLQREHDSQRFAKAKPTRSMNCSKPGAKKIGEYCYTCPSGFKWNGPIITANDKGCISVNAGKHVYSKAVPSGKNGPFCPGGQILNIPNNKCYRCPSGYRPSEGVVDVNSGKRCYKITPTNYSRPTRGERIAPCPVTDVANGKCYQCPTGYSRLVMNPATGTQACENNKTAQRAKVLREKRAKLATLEVAHNKFTNSIADAASELTGVASDICQKAKNTDLINADPEILNSKTYQDWLAYGAIVKDARASLKLLETGTVGSMRAAAWIAKHAGEAAGIVEIHQASFKGCLSAVNGGNVALYVKGEYADAPIEGSFDINLKDPTSGIKSFANQLLNSNTFKATKSNGRCTRPTVPRPNITEGSKVAELMSSITVGQGAENKTKLKDRPKKEARPSWAGQLSFTEDRIDPTKFDTDSNPSMTRTSPSRSTTASNQNTRTASTSNGRPQNNQNTRTTSANANRSTSTNSSNRTRTNKTNRNRNTTSTTDNRTQSGNKKSSSVPASVKSLVSKRADKTFQLINQETGKVLDLDRANGNIIQWNNNGGDNQRWIITPVPGDKFFKIISKATKKSLDVDRANGNIIQYSFHGGGNQLWDIVPIGSAYVIVCKATQRVLEVNPTNGNVHQGLFKGKKTQLWKID